MKDEESNVVSLHNHKKQRRLSDTDKKFQKLSDSVIDLSSEVDGLRSLLNRVLRLLKGKK